MRRMLVALGVAAALWVLAPASPAAAQVYAPCGSGQVVPFDLPQFGLDPVGRPFVLRVSGVYGPYDGFGYPLQAMSAGFYAGVPYARATFGYVPAPCPVWPPVSFLTGYGPAWYGLVW